MSAKEYKVNVLAKPRDPVERVIFEALVDTNTQFIMNASVSGGRTIDFYIPQHDLYIECKRFPSDRVIFQIEGVANAIVIQGIQAAYVFAHMIRNTFHYW